MNRELVIPNVISRIAIISSPAAAGYEDFMNQLIHNSYGYSFETRLYNATMQGENAALSIINALETVHNSNDEFDIILIIRGGGSALDLDCFDNYELNFTAAQFPLPIITGIGHERDQSILDLIAYKSLKTPTAVAEWLIGKSLDFESLLLGKMQRLTNLADKALQNSRLELDTRFFKLKNAADRHFQKERYTLDKQAEQMKRLCNKFLDHQSNLLSLRDQKIVFLDPKAILRRGYSLTSINGKSITTENVKEGDIIETRTLSSILKSSVISKKTVYEKG